MVWCGISYDGKTGIHIYEPGTKVKSGEYIECLEDCLLPSIRDPEYLFPKGQPKKWLFMQDGAGCHRSKKTTKWLDKNLNSNSPDSTVAYTSVQLKETTMGKWPANSPDLNPIENLWAYFSDAVARKDPKTTVAFKALLKKEWWDIDQNYIRNLYHSMPNRLRAVIAAEGRMTKY